jgi:uncharacterized protein (DUF58 family)
MSPTTRTALALAVLAAGALFLPLGIVVLVAVALGGAAVVDALSVRSRPRVLREVPMVLSRGIATPVEVRTSAPEAAAIDVRLRTPAGVESAPNEGGAELRTTLVARERGHYVIGQMGIRLEGRLRLGAWYHRAGQPTEVDVYPDLVGARRLALAAREGRLLDATRRARGPLGMGTDFESVRDWLPDDDIRHVNWRATQRTGRPMTNQYRLEQARDIVFLLDAGRLMAAPLGDRTRLDAALDALAAVALAADELSDHCGTIAFDSEVRRHLRPRRDGGNEVVRALFDLQPRLVDSDYANAFQLVAGGKRALVLVFSDLFDEAAARALIDAVPVIARRHAVIVASVTDPDLDHLVGDPPARLRDVYAASAALDLLDARARAASLIRGTGARVVEAAPGLLPGACVRAYLQAKARLRL